MAGELAPRSPPRFGWQPTSRRAVQRAMLRAWCGRARPRPTPQFPRFRCHSGGCCAGRDLPGDMVLRCISQQRRPPCSPAAGEATAHPPSVGQSRRSPPPQHARAGTVVNEVVVSALCLILVATSRQGDFPGKKKASWACVPFKGWAFRALVHSLLPAALRNTLDCFLICKKKT